MEYNCAVPYHTTLLYRIASYCIISYHIIVLQIQNLNSKHIITSIMKFLFSSFGEGRDIMSSDNGVVKSLSVKDHFVSKQFTFKYK